MSCCWLSFIYSSSLNVVCILPPVVLGHLVTHAVNAWGNVHMDCLCFSKTWDEVRTSKSKGKKMANQKFIHKMFSLLVFCPVGSARGTIVNVNKRFKPYLSLQKINIEMSVVSFNTRTYSSTLIFLLPSQLYLKYILNNTKDSIHISHSIHTAKMWFTIFLLGAPLILDLQTFWD